MLERMINSESNEKKLSDRTVWSHETLGYHLCMMCWLLRNLDKADSLCKIKMSRLGWKFFKVKIDVKTLGWFRLFHEGATQYYELYCEHSLFSCHWNYYMKSWRSLIQAKYLSLPAPSQRPWPLDQGHLPIYQTICIRRHLVSLLSTLDLFSRLKRHSERSHYYFQLIISNYDFRDGLFD